MAPIKVLIIEDQAIIAMDIQSALQRAGYDVVGIATNGEDAGALLQQLRPDAMVLDISFDRKKLSLAKTITEAYSVPVVLIADTMDAYAMREGASIASSGLLIKPFDTPQLIETLNNTIGNNPIR